MAHRRCRAALCPSVPAAPALRGGGQSSIRPLQWCIHCVPHSAALPLRLACVPLTPSACRRRRPAPSLLPRRRWCSGVLWQCRVQDAPCCGVPLIHCCMIGAACTRACGRSPTVWPCPCHAAANPRNQQRSTPPTPAASTTASQPCARRAVQRAPAHAAHGMQEEMGRTHQSSFKG